MPAKDQFHDIVKNALIKDGWTITDDPLRLQLGEIDMYADFGAEKILGAEKNGKKIAVEVKSFMQASRTSEFHTALGQFLNYRLALQGTVRELYLAVDEEIYNTFFTLLLPQTAIQQYQLKLIIYELEKEEIVEWKN
ncbi:MAG: XisH family protein [Cyanobacteriota bacterium]|nr:XisH family protein [Cyanobacteriota bacterium]